MIGKNVIHEQVVEKASKSNTLLILLLVILALNYIIPDPIPLVDELLSFPVIFVLILKILNVFPTIKKPVKEKPKIFPLENHIEEGEIVE